MVKIENEVITKLKYFAKLVAERKLDLLQEEYTKFCDWITHEKWTYEYGRPVSDDPRQNAVRNHQWDNQKKDALIEIVRGTKDVDQLIRVVEILSGERIDLVYLINKKIFDKFALFKTIAAEFILAIVKSKELPLKEKLAEEDLKITIRNATVYIEEKAGKIRDYGLLNRLKEIYLKIEDQEAVNRIDRTLEMLNIADEAKVMLYQYVELTRKEFDLKASSLDRKTEDLKRQNEELNTALEKNRIRLIETVGLFAAIIAFVIAGVVGLQGLKAEGIAISITGLTAGLVVLVTLINIFTSPKQYIWGKVAVLITAFLILVAWMVVTIIFSPSIFN